MTFAWPVSVGRFPAFGAMAHPHPSPLNSASGKDEVIIRFAGAKKVERRPRLDPDQVKLFTGRANPKLAKAIAAYLGMELSPVLRKNHHSSETHVELQESVQGRDVFLIQPTHAPVDRNLMELLLMIDAARQDDAESVTAVIPYYGYARQDRRSEDDNGERKREPISAKLVAKLLKAAGADRVILLDLHNNIQEGFFDIPVTQVSAASLLAEHIGNQGWADAVVVSPDAGGVVRARNFAKKLDLPYVVVEKKRTGHGESEAINIIGGDISGKVCIIFDDMIDTGGTISKSAALLLKAGARKVVAVASHGVFSGNAPKTLGASPFESIIVTDAIPLSRSMKATGKITRISVAQLIGDAIRRAAGDRSVGSL